MIRINLFIFATSFFLLLILSLFTNIFLIKFNPIIILLFLLFVLFLIFFLVKKQSFKIFIQFEFSNKFLIIFLLFGSLCLSLQFLLYGIPIIHLVNYQNFKPTNHLTFFLPLGLGFILFTALLSVYKIFFLKVKKLYILILSFCVFMLLLGMARSYITIILLFTIICLFLSKLNPTKKYIFLFTFIILFSIFFSIYSNLKTNNVLLGKMNNIEYIESKTTNTNFLYQNLFFWPISYVVSPLANLSNIDYVDYSVDKYLQYTFLDESKIVTFGISDFETIMVLRKNFLIDDNFNTSTGFFYPYYFGGLIGVIFYFLINLFFLYLIGIFFISKHLRSFFTIFLSSVMPLIFFTNIFVQPFFIYPLVLIILISIFGHFFLKPINND